MIEQIIDKHNKKIISRAILEALPEWFGILKAREEYIQDSQNQIFFAAIVHNTPIGFLCLKETSKDTVELAVMGVLKENHRQGVGKKLFIKAKEFARVHGYTFMQVKTVKMGCHENYDTTNKFYINLGFKEFEVFPALWDASNPCQIYVMSLK